MDQSDDKKPQMTEGRLSFAVLGSILTGEPFDPDFDLQVKPDIHGSVKSACSMLKLASSIVSALVVHPGAEAEEGAMKEATRELMKRATRLTEAAVELLGLPETDPRLPTYKNLLKQQSVEVVSSQWRLAHGAGMQEVTIDQMTAIYKVALDAGNLDLQAGVPVALSSDEVTGKRMALLEVAPKIYEAVNTFNYFVPDNEELVRKGMQQVMQAANKGVSRIASPNTRPESRSLIAQSLVGKAGGLYAENYKVHARQTVLGLQRMNDVERARHLFIHRDAGLPTAQVDESFHKLMDRMVSMVCEAVPSLDPVPNVVPKQTLDFAVEVVGHEHQPE